MNGFGDKKAEALADTGAKNFSTYKTTHWVRFYRREAVKDSFQVGQTAKARSGYRVQSLRKRTRPPV